MTDWPGILRQHGGIVWKTIRRLIDADADAADCFQETFVAAVEFSRKQSVRNWPGLLKRLATVRALDQLRDRLRSAPIRLTLEGAAESPCHLESPSAVAEQNELFDRLRESLAAMPPDQAEVCCLRFFEDFSYEQIADELGVTVNHVGVLLHRAKSLLQIRLASFAPASHQQTEIDNDR